MTIKVIKLIEYLSNLPNKDIDIVEMHILKGNLILVEWKCMVCGNVWSWSDDFYNSFGEEATTCPKCDEKKPKKQRIIKNHDGFDIDVIKDQISTYRNNKWTVLTTHDDTDEDDDMEYDFSLDDEDILLCKCKCGKKEIIKVKNLTHYDKYLACEECMKKMTMILNMKQF
jgi:hypothetical protein